jgi:hypothetical protein
MRSPSTVLWRHSTGRRPITRRRKGRLGREVLPVIHVGISLIRQYGYLGLGTARRAKPLHIIALRDVSAIVFASRPGCAPERPALPTKVPIPPRREDSVPRGSTSYGVTVAISAVSGDSQKTFVAQAPSVPMQRTSVRVIVYEPACLSCPSAASRMRKANPQSDFLASHPARAGHSYCNHHPYSIGLRTGLFGFLEAKPTAKSLPDLERSSLRSVSRRSMGGGKRSDVSHFGRRCRE